MAKSKKQNYTINKQKKIITANISKLNETEKEIVQMYINAGYELHMGKSNPWNKKSIAKWLNDYVGEKESKKFESDCNDKSIGWVNARQEFFNTYNKEKRKALEDAKKSADSKAE